MISGELKRSLFESAVAVLENAYAPYSGVEVAAAVIDEAGDIYTGVNVENASYGLTVCAERNAIASMVLSGGRRLDAILIVSSVGPSTPCGACRQVIEEFSDNDTMVYIADKGGIVGEYSVSELLPAPFGLKNSDGNRRSI